MPRKRLTILKDVKRGRGIKLKRVNIPDKGKLGLTPPHRKWATFKGTLHGWSKDLPTGIRRARASRGRDDLSSARALQQLANLTTDRKTKRIAKIDADYFFAKNKARR